MKAVITTIFALLTSACGSSDYYTENTEQRRIYPVPSNCPINAEVWLVAGQSNASNWTWHTESREVLVLTPNGCKKETGTLSVGDGIYRNAFQVVASDYTNRTGIPVVLAIVAGGGIPIAEFAQDKEYGIKLSKVLDMLKSWKVDRFIWQHGETDAWFKNSPEQYEIIFESIVTKIKPSISSHVARSTLCTDIPYDNAIGKKLDQLRVKYPGPNTDNIPQDPKYRYDLCHFGNEGINMFSNMWQQYL